MNILKVYDDKIITQEIDDTIKVSLFSKEEDHPIVHLSIQILQDTALQVIYENDKKTYLDIDIMIAEGVTCTLGEIRTGSSYKIHYRYTLQKNSHFYLNRFHHVQNIKEQDTVFLKGENAAFTSVIKTISKEEEKYEMYVIHEAPKTKSHTFHHAANIENGEIKIYVTNEVPKGITGCEIHQNSRIITMNHHKCTIKPILLIDEEDVVADHAAHIGTFDAETLFYLESRGIAEEKAKGLLLKGFLQKDFTLLPKEQINQMIEKYWR